MLKNRCGISLQPACLPSERKGLPSSRFRSRHRQ